MASRTGLDILDQGKSLVFARIQTTGTSSLDVVTILTVLSNFTYLLTIIESAKVSFYLFCLQTSQLFDIGNGLN